MRAAKQIKFIQGDVILTLVAELPEGMVQFNSETKVLQESEVTGHHHHFMPGAAVDLYIPSARSTGDLENLAFTTITPDEGKYISVRDTSTLFHGRDFEYNPHAKGIGDHNALTIPPGIYKVDIVREYDYDFMETRRVAD